MRELSLSCFTGIPDTLGADGFVSRILLEQMKIRPHPRWELMIELIKWIFKEIKKLCKWIYIKMK
jgi:hypothetical protein